MRQSPRLGSAVADLHKVTSSIKSATAPIPVVGQIISALDSVTGFVATLDKSDERKQLAAQRGEYEAANNELITQNFLIDNKVGQMQASLQSVRAQLKQSGLAGIPPLNRNLAGLGALGCDFGIFNCAYDDEKRAAENAKNAYTQLQYENEIKKGALSSIINEFSKLRDYLGLGLDYFKKTATTKSLVLAALGTAAAVGTLIVIFTGKDPTKTKKPR